VDSRWHEYAFDVPADVPPGPPLLRLDVLDSRGRDGTFRPENVLRGSHDDRDLGIAVDRIRFLEAPVTINDRP
jgi:hypothetical protein